MENFTYAISYCITFLQSVIELLVFYTSPTSLLGGCGSVVERVVSKSEGWWFHPRLRWATCQSVFGQDTEPHVAPDGCTIGE